MTNRMHTPALTPKTATLTTTKTSKGQPNCCYNRPPHRQTAPQKKPATHAQQPNISRKEKPEPQHTNSRAEPNSSSIEKPNQQKRTAPNTDTQHRHRTNRPRAAPFRESSHHTIRRAPFPLVKHTSRSFEPSQQPPPRQNLNLFHHFVPPNDTGIENTIVPRFPHSPNNRLPNHSQALPNLFMHHTATPTLPMNNQVWRHYKIQIQPFH